MTDFHLHHIDKRADSVAFSMAALDPSALLSTAEVGKLIGYSSQWLEIGRHRGYGPPFLRVGPRRIRYKVQDVMAWLDERRHRCTDEYMKPKPKRAPPGRQPLQARRVLPQGASKNKAR